MFLRLFSVLVVLAVFMAAQKAAAPPPPVVQFTDATKSAGLTISHITTAQQRYIVESMSGGVGFIDCDNDGKLDIITVNGSTVDRFRQGGDPMITLYHQAPEMKFTDITKEAGLTSKGWGMGIAVADFNNDGLQDIYVTGYGHNVLYRNIGNCKFEDVTQASGVAGGGFSTGAAWADYDRDGNVDLFVSRYVHIDINQLPEFGSNEKFCRFRGILVQCGPWGMEGESDLLYHNRGDGTFEEVSKKAGVDDPAHRYGLGVVWGDYDNDGWPDLYVANDAGANYLYHNNHDGTFEEVGLISGTALSPDGQELGSMGVDFGDYDRDGRLDIFVTNFVDQPDDLYRNLGNGSFADMSSQARINQSSFPFVKWGTGLIDLDNDGWLDLVIANGHVYPQVDSIPGGVRYRQPLQAFRNNHDRTFTDISTSSGLANLPLRCRRGVAFGDVNNDGRVDVLVLNVGEPPTLLLNTTADTNHRVAFKLVGTKSNRAAIGARVAIKAGKDIQFDEVRGGGSYLSQNDLRLHFGLGAESKLDSVTVTWPNGKAEVLHNLAADVIYTIAEGEGVRDRVALPPISSETHPGARQSDAHR